MQVVPDTVNGLPVHALVVHGAVVLVPLLALLGILYAIPRLRGWARWPLALVAIGAAVTVFVAIESGENLEAALGMTGEAAELIERHAELANQLRWMVYGYAVIALLAVALVSPPGSGARSSRATDSREPASHGAGALAVVMSVVLVLGAIAVGVQTVRVGDAGSKAVWGGGDYSTD